MYRYIFQQGGNLRRKKSKRKEIKLEAFSVSENFDPETYIIPIQNRWTIEQDRTRGSDLSVNDEKYLISNNDSVKYRFYLQLNLITKQKKKLEMFTVA